MVVKKKLIIEPSWCKGCGICAEFCPRGVIEVHNEKVMEVNPYACVHCGLCESLCPDYAIYLVNEEE